LIFPDLVRHTSSRPDVIVQITNDAWFGTWSGPYQHLSQAKARAIENGISVVRVANTGISTVIAPDGTLLKALGLGTQGAIDLAVPVPYKTTLYWRFGDLGVAIMLVLMLFAASCGRVRNKMLTSL
ncbi:MAG: apolipoprotein N-acyltransferase, partial [Flavobacteriia bacterium]|nr:apolipoprotein N-acyltransferase [Flavobacteriia bacterium]